MKFNLLDKIITLSHDRIVAARHVSLAEEYLADHFPTFPVFPGVMMLEALTQAAGWLLHHRRGFACSMTILREARNVKYNRFVTPGMVLNVDVALIKESIGDALFKCVGTVDDQTAVQARLELRYFNLAEQHPTLVKVDQQLIEHHRARWALLWPELALGSSETAKRQNNSRVSLA